MRRALLALCVALGVAGAIPAAAAKPIAGSEGYRSPTSHGYIYKERFGRAKELGAGTVIAIVLGVGIAAALAIVLARKHERYTSHPRLPD